MSSSTAGERDSLIASLSELNEESQSMERPYLYASTEQAFFNQTLFDFVVDETHAMMQIICCEVRMCANFYNPLYLAVFSVLFLLTFPGAFLHWLLIAYIPVRSQEYPEERELRSQGIYTAIGIALFSVPFGIAGIFEANDSETTVICEVSVVVNICIIVYSLAALKAIADELNLSTKVFIVGVWAIDIIMIALMLFDVYQYFATSWDTVAYYILRGFAIFVYTVIGVQSIPFWGMYSDDKSSDDGMVEVQRRNKKIKKDAWLAVLLGFLVGVVLFGFLFIIGIGSRYAWRIMYW